MKIKTKTSFGTLFLKTRTQKSAGYDIAGLKLKVWSPVKTQRLKEDGTAARFYCSSAHLVALFWTELFVSCGSGEQSEVVQLEK